MGSIAVRASNLNATAAAADRWWLVRQTEGQAEWQDGRMAGWQDGRQAGHPLSV